MTTRTIVRGEQHLDEIDGYMELGMQEEALRLVRAVLNGPTLGAQDEFTRASMIDALASYHLRLGNCAAALELWRNAPEEPCFDRQRLCGVARARAIADARS